MGSVSTHCHYEPYLRGRLFPLLPAYLLQPAATETVGPCGGCPMPTVVETSPPAIASSSASESSSRPGIGSGSGKYFVPPELSRNLISRSSGKGLVLTFAIAA